MWWLTPYLTLPTTTWESQDFSWARTKPKAKVPESVCLSVPPLPLMSTIFKNSQIDKKIIRHKTVKAPLTDFTSSADSKTPFSKFNNWTWKTEIILRNWFLWLAKFYKFWTMIFVKERLSECRAAADNDIITSVNRPFGTSQKPQQLSSLCFGRDKKYPENN